MLSRIQKTRTLVHFWACQVLESLWEKGQQFSKNLVMWLGDSPSKYTSGHLSERNGNCLLPLWDIWKWLYFRNEEQISGCQRLENRSGVGGEGGRFMRELLIGGVFKRAEGGSSQPWNCSVSAPWCWVHRPTQVLQGEQSWVHTAHTGTQTHTTHTQTQSAYTRHQTHIRTPHTHTCTEKHINRHITHTNHKHTHIHIHIDTPHTHTQTTSTHTHKQTHHVRTHTCCGNSSMGWKRSSRHRGSEFIKNKEQR